MQWRVAHPLFLFVQSATAVGAPFFQSFVLRRWGLDRIRALPVFALSMETLFPRFLHVVWRGGEGWTMANPRGPCVEVTFDRVVARVMPDDWLGRGSAFPPLLRKDGAPIFVLDFIS